MVSRDALLACALAAVVVAPAATGQERPTFTTRSELIVLHVIVEDRKGTYVSGLPKEAFTVEDNGKLQDVQFFSAADTPATIGLLVDSSTSMINKREMVVAAALGFTEMSNAEDELFVLAFNEQVAEIWQPRLIGSSSPAVMRRVLLGGIGARGMTALYDAIARGLDRLAHGRHTRQVLVVISDGDDNASTTTLDEVLARTRSSEAAIFTVILKDPVSREGNPRLMKRLAAETGGEAFEPASSRDLPETLRHIARDIRSAYTLGFAPAVSGEREHRKLKVTVRGPGGRALSARARGGYVGRAGT